jgi:protein-S-isoprenylcysteine O-methyltransferase Ste14
MEWMPALRIGWLNGWLAVALLGLTEGLAFMLLPKEVVARLFDRSGWSKTQAAFTVLGKMCALGCLILLVLTPLKTGAPVFWLGAMLVAAALAGLVKAIADFAGTPLDEPVTRGIYALSRHPQVVFSSLVLLGACIAVGSWPATGLLLLARALAHLGILAEEEVCANRYGEPYRAYTKRIPRYFLFF